LATGQVLVVDDEADIRELLGITLIRMGLEPHCAGSVAEAMELLGNKTFELCLTDMRLGDGDGLSIVEHITKSHPSLPVAVITAHGSAENAVAALKAGAFDYLGKPVSLDQLRALVRSALKLPQPAGDRRSAEAEAGRSPNDPRLIGSAPPLEQARQMIGVLENQGFTIGLNMCLFNVLMAFIFFFLLLRSSVLFSCKAERLLRSSRFSSPSPRGQKKYFCWWM
jgi:two-component system response regulator PilR (NtrC family)